MLNIAITGPESSGKTTLTHALSTHYKAPVVEEYARKYLQEIKTKAYTVQDIENIAVGQMINEKLLINQLNPSLVLVDTEALVCKIWAEYKFGYESEKINDLFSKQQYSLYLLMDVDLPWEFDPLRESPSSLVRNALFQLYKSELQRHQKPFAVISGNGQSRIEAAIKQIDLMIQSKKT